ncbi:DUF6735 family protein [Natrialba sp. PRR66]|uniref:DUF6735 family protein n=1 Tax=Natrialba sp. PRR66 TaxID=3098146 RepID=UPI002B1D7E08|nr:DUF6735 family protein [Natrialba sp. PRR66]
MGHRALVAYRRPDRLYDLRYSHWGGTDLTLADEITAETPLADGTVSSELLADSIARDRILTAHLDPCVHEALFLVDPAANYTVSSYHVCWLEWGDGHGDERGAIVEPDPHDDTAIRTWFRATKTTLTDVIEMGVLARPAAQAYLEARVCEEYGGIVYTHLGSEQQASHDARAPSSSVASSSMENTANTTDTTDSTDSTDPTDTFDTDHWPSERNYRFDTGDDREP